MKVRRAAVLDEFARLDKALGFKFLRNSSGPAYFNEINKELSPQIKVKSLMLIKRIWKESWNVWELDADVLLDVWYCPLQGGNFCNNERQAIRLKMMETLERRHVKFKQLVYSHSERDIEQLAASLGSPFDVAEDWMVKAGFYIKQTIDQKRKQRGLLLQAAPAVTKPKVLLQKKIVKQQLKKSGSLLERIRAKEKELKSQSADREAEKDRREAQKLHDQFEKVYSILYEQAPKFSGSASGITIAKLQELVEDSVTNSLDVSKVSKVVQKMQEKVSGISLIKVGDIEVVKIGKLNREDDISMLKSI